MKHSNHIKDKTKNHECISIYVDTPFRDLPRAVFCGPAHTKLCLTLSEISGPHWLTTTNVLLQKRAKNLLCLRMFNNIHI